MGIDVCLKDENGFFVWLCFYPICNVHVGEAIDLLLARSWVHE
jgi:hypothetical protein